MGWLKFISLFLLNCYYSPDVCWYRTDVLDMGMGKVNPRDFSKKNNKDLFIGCREWKRKRWRFLGFQQKRLTGWSLTETFLDLRSTTFLESWHSYHVSITSSISVTPDLWLPQLGISNLLVLVQTWLEIF